MSISRLNSITISDFLLQIKNIISYNSTLFERAPIRATKDGIEYLIVNALLTIEVGYSIEGIAIYLAKASQLHTTQTIYSIKGIKDRIVSLISNNPMRMLQPIFLRDSIGELSGIRELNVKDMSILGGSSQGIIILGV